MQEITRAHEARTARASGRTASTTGGRRTTSCSSRTCGTASAGSTRRTRRSAPSATPRASARRRRSIEWYRPNPPLDGVRWCIRNNINYQQSGVLVALDYVASNGPRFLENFWLKSRRSVEHGRREAPYAWVIPAGQSRRIEAAELVNLFRLQGIEVHRADTAFTAGGRAGRRGRLRGPDGPAVRPVGRQHPRHPDVPPDGSQSLRRHGLDPGRAAQRRHARPSRTPACSRGR